MLHPVKSAVLHHEKSIGVCTSADDLTVLMKAIILDHRRSIMGHEDNICKRVPKVVSHLQHRSEFLSPNCAILLRVQ